VQLPKGSSSTATVVAYDADGDQTALIAPVLWSVSDPAIATVVGGPGATATVRALRAGTVTITARSGSLVADAALEVQPGPPVRLVIQFSAA
jgi:uncharacterized protein YjdB